MVEHGGLRQIVHSGESHGYTWQSLAQEEIRQKQEASYGVKVISGLADDYTIVPTSDPWMYKLVYITGERVKYLKRIAAPLPPLP